MLSAPQPLTNEHITRHFECGEPTLDDWLIKRALNNQSNGASRTFVVVNGENVVMGYYALSTGAVAHNLATGSIRRNMPDPIPVIVLGRLAVDLNAQGLKVGASVLQDAVHRAKMIAEHTGVRAILVHALHQKAKEFYQYYGFTASPIENMTLMLRLSC